MSAESMKVYLAARYSRREELCDYRAALHEAGFEVTSRWLDGAHQVYLNGEPLGPEQEALIESGHASPEVRGRFAAEDWNDVVSADICINFTEAPRSNASRGGRHVEFGAALALGKRCMVVGWRENVFHCLPEVEFFETWDAAFSVLTEPVEVQE
jgi:nucleoside 2-deoxyribosyltransferase